MTIGELKATLGGKPFVIHTGETLYRDCLDWLHGQGVRWNSGHRLDNQEFDLNTTARDGEDTCLYVTEYRLQYGPLNYYKETMKYIIVEASEILRQSIANFDDIDAILQEGTDQ